VSEFKIGDKVTMPGIPVAVEVLELGTCEEPDCHGDAAEIFRFKDPGGQGGRLDALRRVREDRSAVTADVRQQLTEALDEVERVAHAATPGPWRVDDPTYAEAIYGADGSTSVVAGGRWGGEAPVFNSTADALHIVRWDPATVLRLAAGYREMLDEHRDDRPGWRCACSPSMPCRELRRAAAFWLGTPEAGDG